MKERFELARERICDIAENRADTEEISGKLRDYCQGIAQFFMLVLAIYQRRKSGKKLSLEEKKAENTALYKDIFLENYDMSFTNPTYAREQFGMAGDYLCYFASHFRGAIENVFDLDEVALLMKMELFLQVYTILTTEEDHERWLKETMYYYIHDYDEYFTEKKVKELVDESADRYVKLVMECNFSNPEYLYEYGAYISENEIEISRFLQSLPQETITLVARTYTEGYRKGFEVAGIDLSKKKTVNIRYHIGFERIIREAILQFREMGLEPIVYRRGNTANFGISTTSANNQYEYDHRYDDALYLNHAIVKEKLAHFEKTFEHYREKAAVFAGPAVMEVFGEKLFVPKTKKEAPAYKEEQQKLSVKFRTDLTLIQNRFIKPDERSFTIIAFPIPEIGPQFETIFAETIRVNTLDMDQFRKIQQALIDALDQGEYVHVTGRGANHTDIRVALHQLNDPQKETNFENCLADVNIPVGEVFTSPRLMGTNGVLHVTKVYLNQLRYENLEMVFKDGMIDSYTCSNYETEEENKKYIKENVLYHRETLPMGEFAIGTNTVAYEMGRRFDIEAKLPILIAEKTGPHFAVGDTCYSMSEDIVLHNPDGKEIVAKENECSALRKTDIEKAYFNCHTDITIPYDELGDIDVICSDGSEIAIIHEGKFVLEGTQILNEIGKKS
ncbi:MAG: aminopeptidase [Eubacterium sp.]